ncbi:MAG: hypothetical protein Q9167_006504 [Letrouitia subvulpina]
MAPGPIKWYCFRCYTAEECDHTPKLVKEANREVQLQQSTQAESSTSTQVRSSTSTQVGSSTSTRAKSSAVLVDPMKHARIAYKEQMKGHNAAVREQRLQTPRDHREMQPTEHRMIHGHIDRTLEDIRLRQEDSGRPSDLGRNSGRGRNNGKDNKGKGKA